MVFELVIGSASTYSKIAHAKGQAHQSIWGFSFGGWLRLNVGAVSTGASIKEAYRGEIAEARHRWAAKPEPMQCKVWRVLWLRQGETSEGRPGIRLGLSTSR